MGPIGAKHSTKCLVTSLKIVLEIKRIPPEFTRQNSECAVAYFQVVLYLSWLPLSVILTLDSLFLGVLSVLHAGTLQL